MAEAVGLCSGMGSASYLPGRKSRKNSHSEVSEEEDEEEEEVGEEEEEGSSGPRAPANFSSLGHLRSKASTWDLGLFPETLLAHSTWEPVHSCLFIQMCQMYSITGVPDTLALELRQEDCKFDIFLGFRMRHRHHHLLVLGGVAMIIIIERWAPSIWHV